MRAARDRAAKPEGDRKKYSVDLRKARNEDGRDTRLVERERVSDEGGTGRANDGRIAPRESKKRPLRACAQLSRPLERKLPIDREPDFEITKAEKKPSPFWGRGNGREKIFFMRAFCSSAKTRIFVFSSPPRCNRELEQRRFHSGLNRQHLGE